MLSPPHGFAVLRAALPWVPPRLLRTASPCYARTRRVPALPPGSVGRLRGLDGAGCGYPHHAAVAERDPRAATRRSPVSARQIMTGDDVRRALVRIGHEIVEKHGGASDLALVGIHRRGVP